jgi:hypothetical protein
VWPPRKGEAPLGRGGDRRHAPAVFVSFIHGHRTPGAMLVLVPGGPRSGDRWAGGYIHFNPALLVSAPHSALELLRQCDHIEGLQTGSQCSELTPDSQGDLAHSQRIL